jgi:hypothetical protein
MYDVIRFSLHVDSEICSIFFVRVYVVCSVQCRWLCLEYNNVYVPCGSIQYNSFDTSLSTYSCPRYRDICPTESVSAFAVGIAFFNIAWYAPFIMRIGRAGPVLKFIRAFALAACPRSRPARVSRLRPVRLSRLRPGRATSPPPALAACRACGPVAPAAFPRLRPARLSRVRPLRTPGRAVSPPPALAAARGLRALNAARFWQFECACCSASFESLFVCYSRFCRSNPIMVIDAYIGIIHVLHISYCVYSCVSNYGI